MSTETTDPKGPPAALTSSPGLSNVAPMDTMKLLLGATIALLLGALAVSWQGMQNGVKSAPADEITRLKEQVKELRAEQDRLQLEKLQQLRIDAAPQATSAAEVELLKQQLEEQKRAQAAADAERDKKLQQSEEGLMEQRNVEKNDGELRRARLIADALLMGKIQEYVKDPSGGSFVTFQILMPEQVQVGTILAIRRKTGILGQLKVTDVQTEGAIANPLPGFGPVEPAPGDELILPPPF